MLKKTFITILLTFSIFPIALPTPSEPACVKIRPLSDKIVIRTGWRKHSTFGDGIRGKIPHNSKHEEAQGHIVFGDGEHGVLTKLCPEVSTAH